MAPAQRRRPFPSRAFRIALRLTAVVTIVFGPIIVAAWSVHRGDPFPSGFAEVSRGAPGAMGERVREYLERRHPKLDRLLPEGKGGTRFFEELDGKAGMAFLRGPAVGLSVSIEWDGWPEAIELHERAHLMHAFLPEQVGQLIARLPAAQPNEYAATNRSEHLAEMAAAAWEAVMPPGAFCVDASPSDRLRDAERRIPGTAGFADWYLRHVSVDDLDGHAELSRVAASLVAPYRLEWAALWEAVEARRLPHGGFQPWGYRTAREYLEAWRADARTSEHWFDRIGGVLLTPSLLVLAVTGY